MVEVDFIPEKVSQKVVLLKMIEVSTGLPYRQVDSDVDHCNWFSFLCPQGCGVSGV